ncbi:MAG TPA: hypothetical protein VNM22_02025 [Candidatus Limnocylindrales bacterium]|nr:hypothetical protein [Candidatus Limnocylindrales bacterium]
MSSSQNTSEVPQNGFSDWDYSASDQLAPSSPYEPPSTSPYPVTQYPTLYPGISPRKALTHPPKLVNVTAPESTPESGQGVIQIEPKSNLTHKPIRLVPLTNPKPEYHPGYPPGYRLDYPRGYLPPYLPSYPRNLGDPYGRPICPAYPSSFSNLPPPDSRDYPEIAEASCP